MIVDQRDVHLLASRRSETYWWPSQHPTWVPEMQHAFKDEEKYPEVMLRPESVSVTFYDHGDHWEPEKIEVWAQDPITRARRAFEVVLDPDYGDLAPPPWVDELVKRRLAELGDFTQQYALQFQNHRDEWNYLETGKERWMTNQDDAFTQLADQRSRTLSPAAFRVVTRQVTPVSVIS